MSGELEEEEQTWSNPKDRTQTKLVWRKVPPDSERCRAIVRSRSSPWAGNQCARPAIHGGTVCISHGGRLPNVKKAAQRRLAMAALPAVDRLIYMALQKPRMSDADRLKAILAILDRSGVEAKAIMEVEVKPWQDALRQLLSGVNGETDSKELEAEAEEEILEGVDFQWSPDTEDEGF